MRQNEMSQHTFSYEYFVNSVVFLPFTLLHVATLDPNAIAAHPLFPWVKLLLIQIVLPAAFATWRLMRRRKTKRLEFELERKAKTLKETESILSSIKTHSEGTLVEALAQEALLKIERDEERRRESEED